MFRSFVKPDAYGHGKTLVNKTSPLPVLAVIAPVRSQGRLGVSGGPKGLTNPEPIWEIRILFVPPPPLARPFQPPQKLARGLVQQCVLAIDSMRIQPWR